MPSHNPHKLQVDHMEYTPTQWSVIVLSPINDACFVCLFVCLVVVLLLLFFVCLFLFFYNVTLAYEHVYIVSRRS